MEFLNICGICEIESNTIVGTLLISSTPGMTKEKRFPTSEHGRWVSIDGKIFEILRYCDRCYSRYCLKKDIFNLDHE